MSINSKAKRDRLKKKKTAKLSRPKQALESITTGPVFASFEHPFSKLSDEQRKSVILELSTDAKIKTEECFSNLASIIKQYDPLVLVSILATYGLITSASDNGIEEKESSLTAQQAHIEILQALILRISESDFGKEPPTPNIVQKTFDGLKNLSDHAFLSRIDPNVLDKSETEKAINHILAITQSNTQMVRNWGFHSQILTMTKELYGYFDKTLLEYFGFTASSVVDVFECLLRMIEEELTRRHEILAEIYNVKKPDEMLKKYCHLIGFSEKERQDIANIPEINCLTHKKMFGYLLSFYDLSLSDIYKVNIHKISDSIELNIDIVEKIICYFSYSPGSLSSQPKDHFFLGNPIWYKPILTTTIGNYCFLPQMFFSYSMRIMDELIEQIDKNGLSTRRSVYLESKVEEIVKRRFPESHVISSFKWRDGKTQYENDLVAFIDSHAIVIEAKSHKVTWEALRGAQDRLKRHVDDILIQPSQQSYRLEALLSQIKNNQVPSSSIITPLPINLQSINKVIRVSVSLEDLAMLQANLSEFKDTGWLPPNFVPCPSMNIADFETLFDILEHPVQIIHYLARRAELEQRGGFRGDELDYIGLYLSTLLNIDQMINKDQTIAILTGFSEPLDKYYMSKDSGIMIEKPQPKISPLFKKIFLNLEARSTPRWTEIGYILNSFSPDDQFKLMAAIKELAPIVHKRWEIEGHKNMIILKPTESPIYALVIVLLKDGNMNRRYEFINHATLVALEESNAKSCLTIAINLDMPEQAYHYIALANASELQNIDQNEVVS